MFKKILVANRGEIAVRIVRACSEMGIKSVAIYADADRQALHVKKADEAYNVGADPVAGYLNAHNIVNLAVASGCDALHPGYGFLSENPELAEICERRGVKFIGPSADVIVVYAKTDINSGHKGISTFIVEKGTRGFSVAQKLDKLGMRGSETGELVFEDCEIPAENLIGKEGAGVYILMKGLDYERLILGAGALGIAQAALDESLKYTSERKQFN